jgi:hypothetical protein
MHFSLRHSKERSDVKIQKKAWDQIRTYVLVDHHVRRCLSQHDGGNTRVRDEIYAYFISLYDI